METFIVGFTCSEILHAFALFIPMMSIMSIINSKTKNLVPLDLKVIGTETGFYSSLFPTHTHTHIPLILLEERMFKVL